MVIVSLSVICYTNRYYSILLGYRVSSTVDNTQGFNIYESNKYFGEATEVSIPARLKHTDFSNQIGKAMCFLFSNSLI